MKRCMACDATFESASWHCPACGHTPEEIGGWPAFAPKLAASNDGYDPESFLDMPGFDDEHFLRRARNQLFSWALGRYFSDATRYLEIGAGIGVVLAAIQRSHPRLEIWGSEIYAAGLRELARNVPGVHAFQADARRLPFRDEFDVIGAFDTLEHIDDDEGVLAELHAATRPHGGILVSVPQHPFLWSARDEAVFHKRRYRRGELLSKIRDAGFDVVRATSFMTLPFPALLWQALRNRRRREGYDPFAEFRIGASASALLGGILTSERFLIQRGVSFPFGGTLFVAARRR